MNSFTKWRANMQVTWLSLYPARNTNILYFNPFFCLRCLIFCNLYHTYQALRAHIANFATLLTLSFPIRHLQTKFIERFSRLLTLRRVLGGSHIHYKMSTYICSTPTRVLWRLSVWDLAHWFRLYSIPLKFYPNSWTNWKKIYLYNTSKISFFLIASQTKFDKMATNTFLRINGLKSLELILTFF